LIGEEPASSTAKKEKPLAEDNTKAVEIDNNTFNYYNNSNCYATMVYAGELIKQADELYLIETAIRSEAKTKHGEAKQKLLAAAKELRNQGQLKQIQASEISGKINLQNFKNGEVVYNGLLFKATNKELLQDAQSLHSDANYSIRLAKELREEAYSLADNSAKLGTMTNAEEKEAIALKTQTAAIHLLKCAIAFMDSEFLNDIAMK
ncbi:MAG: hypothetical protein K0S12_2001, partial [Bacteroidetes bacterium]|nr:hypothetical protein [Bacteroidota bacterium]